MLDLHYCGSTLTEDEWKEILEEDPSYNYGLQDSTSIEQDDEDEPVSDLQLPTDDQPIETSVTTDTMAPVFEDDNANLPLEDIIYFTC